jgi:hypothetical protein
VKARPAQKACRANGSLFLTVLFGMSAASFFGMITRVARVAAGGVRMVRRFFVLATFVMLGGFAVMLRSLGMVF